MRVRELTCSGVDIPPQQATYVMSYGRVLDAFPTTVVKVTAEDGTVGYGEAAPSAPAIWTASLRDERDGAFACRLGAPVRDLRGRRAG